LRQQRGAIAAAVINKDMTRDAAVRIAGGPRARRR
jgi:hypothetical protein